MLYPIDFSAVTLAAIGKIVSIGTSVIVLFNALGVL